jgi:hypothetical protein
MKKLAYAKPTIRVITLYPTCLLMTGSRQVKRFDNNEGLVLDDDGLNNEDELR